MAQTASAAAVLGPKKLRKFYPQQYIRHFLSAGSRPDGRTASEARNASLNTGTISTADGSATVRLGSTYVTCGIKAEVAIPPVSEPKHGYFVPNIDLPAMCSPKFRRGPPSDLTQVLSFRLDQLCRKANLVNLEDLCISEGNAAWVLYADIVCINYGGSIFDAALLALVAALQNVRLPVATYDEGAGAVTATSAKDVQLKLNRVPLSVTTALLEGQILVDPTEEEEDVAGTTVTVAFDENGNINYTYKSGGTTMNRKEMEAVLNIAEKRSEELRELLASAAAE